VSDELNEGWQILRITDYYSHKIVAPSSWVQASFSEICRIIGGSQPPKECFVMEQREGYIRLIQIRDYKTDKFATYIPTNLAKRFCNKGDIMIGRYGPPIFQILRGLEGSYNVALMKAEPNPQLVDKEFLYYFLQTANLFNYIAAASLRTAGQDGVRKEHLDNYPVFVPPLNEQRRIVAKIEELRERSQKARSHLSAIPNLCNKFRQSVLAAAFRGDLTADWREQNPDVEPAQVLLERIGKELGQNLADVQTEIDRTDDEIPSTWAWAKLKLMIKKIQPGNNFLCPEVPVTETTVGLVKISAVTWGTFNPKETKTVADPSKVDPNLFIQPGDLLVTRANTLELVGASVVVDEIHYKIMLSDKVWRVDILEVDKKYINFYLRSKDGRKEIESRATGNQLSMRNISQNAFRDVVIAIPPIEEQKEIGRQIESCFNSINQSKQAYQETKDYLNQLDRSILAKAFRGELVEQDPNDEPASILLERIRAEREQQTQGKAKKPGKKGQRTIKTDPP